MSKRFVIIVGIAVVAGVVVSRLLARSSAGSVTPPPDIVANNVRSGAVAATERAPLVFDRNKLRQRDVATSDPRYDPTLLQQEEELLPRETYSSEPRDKVYAPIFEKRVRTSLALALHELNIDKKVLAVVVECKTLTCFTYVEVAKSDGREMYDLLNGLPLGNSQQPDLVVDENSEHMGISFYYSYQPEMRSEHTYDQLRELGQRAWIARAIAEREQKKVNEAPR